MSILSHGLNMLAQHGSQTMGSTASASCRAVSKSSSDIFSRSGLEEAQTQSQAESRNVFKRMTDWFCDQWHRLSDWVFGRSVEGASPRLSLKTKILGTLGLSAATVFLHRQFGSSIGKWGRSAMGSLETRSLNHAPELVTAAKGSYAGKALLGVAGIATAGYVGSKVITSSVKKGIELGTERVIQKSLEPENKEKLKGLAQEVGDSFMKKIPVVGWWY
jgi:hypothetical protein